MGANGAFESDAVAQAFKCGSGVEVRYSDSFSERRRKSPSLREADNLSEVAKQLR